MDSSQRDGTSAADAMVEKIQFQKILKNLRLFAKNHSCIATFRPLPGSQQLPLVLQTTPLAPQVPPGSTPIDGGGILLFLDFRHFRPTRTPHPTTPYTLRTLDHRPDSESQPQPLFFHLARKTPRFWCTLKSGPVGGRDLAVAHAVQDTGP